MKIILTTKEKNDLLREVLTGAIETSHFKRLFSREREERPIFNIAPNK